MTKLNIKNKKNSVLKKEDYRIIDAIKIDEIKNFALESLEQHGTVEKLKEANKVGDILLDLLHYKNLINEHTNQSFVHVMLGAALIHNLFYTENDWATLFHARRDLEKIADESGINRQVQNALFSTVEAQLGDRTPVSDCIPKPGTPTELFAYAVWFAKRA